jgi:cytochrome c oxidase cbb3-type subunit 3
MNHAVAVILCAATALSACKREERQWRTDPPVAAKLDEVEPMANRINGATPTVLAALGEPYDGNAYQLSQGKRLYGAFNCQGCHADGGGGGSAPALMDGWWRYGPDRVSIFLSIRDGRPHGMPAFGRRMTTDQIWQLTGYIRTLGAYYGKSAAPSRNDAMQSHPAENRAPAAIPPRRPPSL